MANTPKQGSSGILSDPLTRQLIVIVLALLVVSGGLMLLVSQNAPYHPDDFSQTSDDTSSVAVSRSDTAYLLMFRPPATRGTLKED